MRFQLIDAVVEEGEDRLTAVKNVSLAEEYLADHFPTFPVLPGVLMVEAMVQAARRLAERRMGQAAAGLVLGEARAFKFGSFVKPGESLRVEVTLTGQSPDGTLEFKGTGTVVRIAAASATDGTAMEESAVTGRFALRPRRIARTAVA